MFCSEHKISNPGTAIAANGKRRKAPAVQPKLKVGSPNDVFEQEADAVADTVMQKPKQNFVQRKCGEQIIQRDGPADTGVTDDDRDLNQFQLHATFTPSMHAATGFRPKMDFMPVMGELNFRNVPFAGDYYNDANAEFLRQYEWYKSLGMGRIAQNAARVPVLKYLVPDLPGNDPDAALANLTTSMAVGSYLRKDYPLETEIDSTNMHVFNLKTWHFDLGGGARRKCKHCEEEEKQLQKKESPHSGTTTSTNSVEQTIQSPGRILDKGTQSFMEQRFGYGFGDVRIHDDDLAHQSSNDINAHAYTVGNHISFAAGKYQPQSDDGRHLLAHELAHVVQQTGSDKSTIHRKTIGQQKGYDPDSTIVNEKDMPDAIEQMIQTSSTLQPYLDASAGKVGEKGKFKVKIGYANLLAAYKECYGHEYDGDGEIGGFYCRKNDMIYVVAGSGKERTSTLGDAVHEGVHKKSKSGFANLFTDFLNEGVTQFFADKVLVDQKLPEYKGHNYKQQLACAKDMVRIAGMDDVAKEYFQGNNDLLNNLNGKLSAELSAAHTNSVLTLVRKSPSPQTFCEMLHNKQ